MDKSTDSSNTSSGNHGGGSSSDAPTPQAQTRDISLGCGPSAAVGNNGSAASATASPQTTALTPPPTNNTITPSTTLGAAILPVTATSTSTTTLPPINLNINTTTGGNFSVTVDPQISVESLKKIIAKKLKVAKDRICLLHREKELQDGILKDNNLMDGSKIILIPNVETGLLAQRPENTVMQALESLNDSQVNDFLSGKTPLNLSMRLGDHMMLIQLQLSTVNPVNSSSIHGSSCNPTRTRSGQRISRSTSTSAPSVHHNHHSHHHHHHHHHNSNATTSTAAGTMPSLATAATTSAGSTQVRKMDVDASAGAACPRAIPSSINRIPASLASNTTLSSNNSNTSIKSSDLSSFLSKRDYESLQNIVKSIAMAQPNRLLPAVTTTAINSQMQQTVSAPTATTAVAGCVNNINSNQIVHTIKPNATTATNGFHHTSSEAVLLEQSPIKSLSNLVSSPIKTTAIKNIPISNGSNSSSSSSSSSHVTPTPVMTSTAITSAAAASAVAACQDPIAAKLTSCLCTRLNGGTNIGVKTCIESSCVARQDLPEHNLNMTRTPIVLTSTPNYKSSATPSNTDKQLHKTTNNPISRSKHRHHHHHHHHHHHYHHQNSSYAAPAVRAKLPLSTRFYSAATTTSSSNDSGFASDESNLTATTSNSSTSLPATPIAASSTSNTTAVEMDDSGITVSDSRTLAEASRNLTQTLRKLSKEVFTNKIDLSASEEAPRKSGSGAVIESMKNHGKGIYSGTFSGTLNPALQDRYGRPKRDISTVIHILNDLLSATPQYSRGARISFEAPTTSSAAANAGNTINIANIARHKQISSKHTHNCSKCVKSHAHSHSTCAYGECNGHYVSKSAKLSYPCCQDISSSSNSAASSSNADTAGSNERNMCTCRYRILNEATGEREREHMCQKCLYEMENLKTKSKLDQLRLVMQQSKQKREARKLKGAPYGARVVGATTAGVADATAAAVQVATTGATPLSASTTTQLTATPSEVSPNHMVEEVDTAA
ncbi:midnolin homolog [Teleopsis dalmanni]|uniref:midnolin homolog n=1 Tax=Teleopsis dalmanni TaxID=139649 RepID=UPI0018CED1A4|nr:midnolin homolog [Teleopsis dalmanni]